MKYLKKKKGSCYSGNKYFDVENIITRKKHGKKYFYLIKWEGYSIAECTWEPTSNLNNVLEKVKEFDNNFPISINQKLLNEFLIEYKRYNTIKLLKKKKKKNIYKFQPKSSSQFTNIIIPLNDTDEEITGDEEEHKINESEQKNFYINNNNNDMIGNELNNEVFNYHNHDKLIRPILIW